MSKLTYYQKWYKKNKEKAKEYHKKYYQDNKENYSERDKINRKKESYILWKKQYRKDYKKKNPKKVSAMKKVQRLVADGRIKKLPCQICEDKNIELHHPNYSKPFEVYHLCPKHHRKEHKYKGTLKNINLYDYSGLLYKRGVKPVIVNNN